MKEKPTLQIEGSDDQHAICHLLIRHGIDYDSKPWPADLPKIKVADSVEKLLAGMELSIQMHAGRPIGFVLDADRPLNARWDAVRQRLDACGIIAPPSPPKKGFVAAASKYNTTVGVWLMPDNENEGALENFLQTLIDERDLLIHHAQAATDEAKRIGARFSATKSDKALLHTWLAWQEEPGLPFGTAIRARYFRHDSPAAARFVDWFRRVYGL